METAAGEEENCAWLEDWREEERLDDATAEDALSAEEPDPPRETGSTELADALDECATTSELLWRDDTDAALLGDVFPASALPGAEAGRTRHPLASHAPPTAQRKPRPASRVPPDTTDHGPPSSAPRSMAAP